LRRILGHALQTGEQFRLVAVHDGNQFIIFDVPETASEVDFAQESEVGEQLPEPHVG
jgi:hypothetical protein